MFIRIAFTIVVWTCRDWHFRVWGFNHQRFEDLRCSSGLGPGGLLHAAVEKESRHMAAVLRLVCREWRSAVDAAVLHLPLPPRTEAVGAPLFLRFPGLQGLSLGDPFDYDEPFRDENPSELRTVKEVSRLRALRSLSLFMYGCAHDAGRAKCIRAAASSTQMLLLLQ